MVYTETSKRLSQSKLTLVLLLVFVCQVFTTGSVFSVQYPDGEHTLGVEINHHHSHSHNHSHDSEPSMLEITKGDVTTEQSEHDHTNHSHISYYPLENLAFAADFYQADTVDGDFMSYQDCQYAPPIPPPNA